MDRPKCPKCLEYEWPDPQDPVEGSEFCVFHAPVEGKGVPENEFNNIVTQRLLAARGDGILSGAIFPHGILFRDVDLSHLRNIKIDRAIFHGGAAFVKVNFGKRVTFSRTIFKDAYFFGSEFSTVIFDDAKFMNFVFSNSNVKIDKKLNETLDKNWTPSISFINATFDGDAIFANGEFNGDFSFFKAHIKSKLYIDNINVFGCLAFGDLIAGKNCVCIKGFSANSIEKIRLSKEEMDLFSFSCCSWPDVLIQEREANNLLQYNACEEIYRSLKQKSASEHDQPMVSKWHYREKLMALKQLKAKKPWRYIISMTWLYHAFSGFGEKPGWAGAWLLGFVFGPLIALALHALWQTGFSSSFDPEKTAEVFTYWLRCIPFIRQDASTMGTAGQLGAGLMQILIALQAALFGFALRNKFRR